MTKLVFKISFQHDCFVTPRKISIYYVNKFNIHQEDWFNFDLLQELFLARITKTITKTSKLSKKKKRGWFTKEAMQRTLNWSASLAPTSKDGNVVASNHFENLMRRTMSMIWISKSMVFFKSLVLSNATCITLSHFTIPGMSSSS